METVWTECLLRAALRIAASCALGDTDGGDEVEVYDGGDDDVDDDGGDDEPQALSVAPRARTIMSVTIRRMTRSYACAWSKSCSHRSSSAVSASRERLCAARTSTFVQSVASFASSSATSASRAAIFASSFSSSDGRVFFGAGAGAGLCFAALGFGFAFTTFACDKLSLAGFRAASSSRRRTRSAQPPS